MAGLGLSGQNSTQATSHSAEGLTSIPLWFFVLVLYKMLPLLPECSGATFAKNKRFYPQKRVLGARAGCGDATSLHKNLVKKRKTNFRRQAIHGPIFLWLMQGLKAVTMGVVAACGIFWPDR